MARVAGARLFPSTVKQSAEDAEDACSASLRSPPTPSSVTSASATAAAALSTPTGARRRVADASRRGVRSAPRVVDRGGARGALSAARGDDKDRGGGVFRRRVARAATRRDVRVSVSAREGRARGGGEAAAVSRAWRASTEDGGASRRATARREPEIRRRAVRREAPERVARVAFRAWRLVRHRAVRGAGALRARSEARVRFRVGATAFEGWRRVAESGRIASRGAVDAAKLALNAAAARETARLRLARRAARFAGRVASRRAARAFERWRDVRTTRHPCSNARATRSRATRSSDERVNESSRSVCGAGASSRRARRRTRRKICSRSGAANARWRWRRHVRADGRVGARCARGAASRSTLGARARRRRRRRRRANALGARKPTRSKPPANSRRSAPRRARRARRGRDGRGEGGCGGGGGARGEGGG